MNLEMIKNLLHAGVEKVVEDLEKELPEKEVVTVQSLEEAATKLKESLKQNKNKSEDIKKITWVVWIKKHRVYLQ